MTFAEFHKGLRLLRSIDRHEVPSLTAEQWFMFNNAPYEFFIACSTETAEKIWQALEARR